jgi:methylenetetrahydrofolate reductase (NADPH)
MTNNRFKEILVQRDQFILTVELVPGRGSRGKTHEELLDLASKAARSGFIHALSITDNPGGHPALGPEVIGAEISRMGIDPIIHFTCKDKNRNQMASLLYTLDRLHIHNLLVMTGDYPNYGFEGKAKPVYDLDAVQALRLMGRMNTGLDIDSKAPGGGTRLHPTHFIKGCVVSPFKQLASETMTQYAKLWKKLRAGADFVITQVGFDARKFDEVLRYMRRMCMRTPILGNVYILNAGVARVMNEKRVPGCVVTDRLFRQVQEESAATDRGRAAGLMRAAKLIAVLRGMGYDGVHIGGPSLKYEEIEWVIGMSKEWADNWESLVSEFDYAQSRGFYLFEKDPDRGLNNDNLSGDNGRAGKSLNYGVMRFFPRVAFTPGTRTYEGARLFFRAIESTRLAILFTKLEYWIKFITSRCRRCGDCTLAEVAFLCPQSQCPKFLVSGPCGGSSEGWCEVFPGKRRCIYVRAYNRLKAYGELEQLKGDFVPPRNWELDQTSSWANYFMGKDHLSRACNTPIQVRPMRLREEGK